MMEGAGNFSVKRKRSLDHLYISEIKTQKKKNKKKKKRKGKMNWPTLF